MNGVTSLFTFLDEIAGPQKGSIKANSRTLRPTRQIYNNLSRQHTLAISMAAVKRGIGLFAYLEGKPLSI